MPPADAVYGVPTVEIVPLRYSETTPRDWIQIDSDEIETLPWEAIMKKLLVNLAELTEAHREAIAGAAEKRGWEAVFCEGEAAFAAARDAEVIFSPDTGLLKAAEALKWLNVPSAGAEAYLDPALYARGETVLTNSAGAYGVTIAEHIVMVTLELMRRQMEYERVVAERGWERGLAIRSIRGSRVTLLGTGDIGATAAARLRGFEPRRIVGVNRTGHPAAGPFDAVLPLSALDELLPETDLLVMALPGTPETAGLMDRRRLSLLPGEAYLVNVGRGSAVDEVALVDLLRAGNLAGAALDVFRTEPLPADSPLWDCPRLRITPHMAGNMTLGYTKDTIVALFLENFERYCDGKPLKRVVTREKGY